MATEWPVLSLREAGVQLLDCDHRTPPPADNGYPYIAIPQIKQGRLDLMDVRRISREHFVEWTKKTFPQADDVIVSRRCNPGESAFVPADLECALGQNLVILRADGSRILPQFLRWLVRGTDWWEQVQTFINVGAVFDSLKCADIPLFRFPIPALDEQRAIAHILGTLDDKIELNRRTNETLEAIARAIFKSWFVDFDPVRTKAALRLGTPSTSSARPPAYPGADVGVGVPRAILDVFPDHFEESELGDIPAGWDVARLGDEFNLTMGQSPPGETYNQDGEGLPFFQGRADFGFRYPAKRVYCTAPTRFASPGDTLVSVRAPVGDINMAIEPSSIGRGVAAILHKSGSRSYTYYAMQSLSHEFANFEAEGTVFGCINKNDFHTMATISPPDLLLREFERMCFPLDQAIENNEMQSVTLAKLRDTLLPSLLSGDICVKVPDSFTRGLA